MIFSGCLPGDESVADVPQELSWKKVKYVHSCVTPWQSVFLVQLTVLNLIKKFYALYRSYRLL